MNKTLFGPAKNKIAAKNISIKNPSSAHRSTQWLSDVWDGADTDKDRRLAVKWATLAMNRANASAKRRNLSEREQREFIAVAAVYMNCLDNHRMRR
jgi:hypothetical protein